MGADMAKLMHCHHTGKYNIVAHSDVTRQRTAVGKDAIVPHYTVVGDMAICLNKTVFADDGFPTVLCAAVYGDAFADGGIVADFSGGVFSVKFQVLRNSGNNRARKYTTVLADTCPIHNGNVCTDPGTFFNDDNFMDGNNWLNKHIAGNFSLRIFIC